MSHSSRADLTLKSPCVMSSAPADQIGTRFNVLFSTFAIFIVFSRYPSSTCCVLWWRRFPKNPSRTLLFCGARLLISDFTWFPLRCDPPSLSDPDGLGCPALFSSALSPLSQHHRQCRRRCLLESHPAWVLSSLLPSRRQCQCSGHCLRCRWVAHLNLTILRRRLECVVFSVQRNFLLRLLLGMTDDTSPFQYPSHSWILGRVSFCTIDSFVSRSQSSGPRRVASQQGFNSSPACFAMGLLSPLSCPQVPAPETPFAETPLIEVCSPKVGPCDFALHQNFDRGTISLFPT